MAIVFDKPPEPISIITVLIGQNHITISTTGVWPLEEARQKAIEMVEALT